MNPLASSNIGEVTSQITALRACYIKIPFGPDEGKKDIIVIKLELQNLREKLT